MLQARVLMCEPMNFSVQYIINPWMNPDEWGPGLAAIAILEWNSLEEKLKELGVEVLVKRSEENVPDLVFTANSAIVLDGKALLPRYRYKERRGEEEYNQKCFSELVKLGLLEEMKTIPKGVFQEGAGDCIWDSYRQMFWAGSGPRSSVAACPIIENYFDKEVVNLNLIEDSFYHLDTCFMPLTDGHVIYYPEAISKLGLQKIQERVKPDQLIRAKIGQASELGVNMINIGNHIVTTCCPTVLKSKLESFGYTVHLVNLDKFKMSGGGAFCLTLRLDRKSYA